MAKTAKPVARSMDSSYWNQFDKGPAKKVTPKAAPKFNPKKYNAVKNKVFGIKK